MERDPVKAFLLALKRYVRERGHMLFSMARTSGQQKVKVALRGLWRRHEPEETGYAYFMEAVEELRRNPVMLQRLKEYGIEELIDYEEEPYAVVDLEKLSRMLKKLEEL